MPRLSLTRGEINALTTLLAAADSAGTEADYYQSLDPEEQETFFERLDSAWEKLAAARATTATSKKSR